MRFRLILVGWLAASIVGFVGGSADAGSKETCQRGCNKRCHGAKNKSKCVNECRRACR